MRILYVHAPGDPRSFGGIQTYASELARGMREREHEVHELVFDPPKVLSGGGDFFPRRPYWHPEFLWRRSYYQDFRYHQAVQRSVANSVAEFRPDILHVMHVHQLGALEASSVASVVSCHGLELNVSELVRRSVQRANAVHCNSQFTSDYLHSMQPGAPVPRVLRWGVRELPVERSAEPPEYDLITVSRLVPRKNIETVLRALRTRPELRYAIVGDGPDREALQRRAQEWGLSRVSFLGEIDEDAKWRALSRSRAFVLIPRRDLGPDVEGLGLVYYEAFSAGLPVLAGRSGGVPEAVGDGGIVIDDPLAADAVIAAIDELLGSDTHEHWRQAASARAESDSWTSFMEGFESLYSETRAGQLRNPG